MGVRDRVREALAAPGCLDGSQEGKPLDWTFRCFHWNATSAAKVWGSGRGTREESTRTEQGNTVNVCFYVKQRKHVPGKLCRRLAIHHHSVVFRRPQVAWVRMGLR